MSAHEGRPGFDDGLTRLQGFREGTSGTTEGKGAGKVVIRNLAKEKGETVTLTEGMVPGGRINYITKEGQQRNKLGTITKVEEPSEEGGPWRVTIESDHDRSAVIYEVTPA